MDFVVSRGEKLSRGFTVYGRNFEMNTGRATNSNYRAICEAHRATQNLGTSSAFAARPRKTTDNLDRLGSNLKVI
jgi:hypothetical protein